MNPHITEALIGGLITAAISAFIGWLQGRDTKTRLVLKVEEHDKDICALQETVTDHGERIVRLETKVERVR